MWPATRPKRRRAFSTYYFALDPAVAPMLGVCADKLGNRAEAETAYTAAAATTALLTEDGPSVKELAVNPRTSATVRMFWRKVARLPRSRPWLSPSLSPSPRPSR